MSHLELPLHRHIAKARGISQYFTNKLCKHNHLSPRYTASGQCVACAGVAMRKWQDRNKAVVRQHHKAYIDRLKREDVAQYLLLRTRSHAPPRGIEVSLSKEDIFVPDVCPVLGTAWDWKDTEKVPSLDRIDNGKGYVPENVRVISYRANRLKSDATLEEMEKIVAYMKNNT